MNYLTHYFNDLKVRKGFTQDKQAAEFLGLTPQDFNRAKKTGIISDQKCFELAAAIDQNPARIIAARELLKAKNESQRETWKQYFDAVATVTAVAIAFVMLVSLPGAGEYELAGLLTVIKFTGNIFFALFLGLFSLYFSSLFPVTVSTGTATG